MGSIQNDLLTLMNLFTQTNNKYIKIEKFIPNDDINNQALNPISG